MVQISSSAFSLTGSGVGMCQGRDYNLLDRIPMFGEVCVYLGFSNKLIFDS
jgi:hypothetical protein